MSRGPALRPVILRNGYVVENPTSLVLACIEAGWVDTGETLRPESFDEPDLRFANRGGARISAVEIATVLERRLEIERALRAIAPDASLTGPSTSVPWGAVRQLFEGFADVRGIGLSKVTKVLHPKRPALIPILDSLVVRHLEKDDLGAKAPFAERAVGLVRGFRRDLDDNRAAVRAVRQELTRRGYRLTDVRILDLLIWSVEADA